MAATLGLLPTLSPNFTEVVVTIQTSPTIQETTKPDVSNPVTIGDDIITPAPVGGPATSTPSSVVDSSLPKITIETVRVSTKNESTPDAGITSRDWARNKVSMASQTTSGAGTTATRDPEVVPEEPLSAPVFWGFSEREVTAPVT
ncbi:hypothetical protein F5Y19DRAFT_444426 [Xylariaceae sp. FL1651]|nr:hypothetical protein F5Y19DRAFT_444426 [Xylariaceae sp. FL1651]